MNIIKELRLKRGITQSELAELCSVHQTAVSQWEKGRTLPDKQTLVRLSDIFNVSVDLLMGKNETSKKNLIPVLGYVRAGMPIEAYEDVIEYVEIPDAMATTGDYFGLKVTGDSMTPKICPDDIVIIHKQDYIESGEIGVVLVNDLDATVKKVIKKGTSLTLVPFNSAYEPMIFTPEEIVTLPVRIIGKVVELRRSFI
ncbi:MAG: XRE family transcriptional regulator [Clostridia bacterium]|nr:XRE family transcriptional regulator [Clostridia bacterium]